MESLFRSYCVVFSRFDRERIGFRRGCRDVFVVVLGLLGEFFIFGR